MTSITDNPYRAVAQIAKAGVFASYLAADFSARGCLNQAPNSVARFTDEKWDTISFALGQNPPSDETKTLIRSNLSTVVAGVRELSR